MAMSMSWHPHNSVRSMIVMPLVKDMFRGQTKTKVDDHVPHDRYITVIHERNMNEDQ